MLGLVAITINQNVLHSHVRLLLRSLNLGSRRTSDLAVLEIQTGRKTLNRDGILLDLKALRQSIETFRLDILGVIFTNNTISQRRIRHHNLGNNLPLTRLLHLLLRGLLDTLILRCIRILVHRITLSIDLRNPLLDLNINRAGHNNLSGTSLRRRTSDLAGLVVNFEALRQLVSRVLRLSALSLLLRQITKQGSNIIGRVRIVTRAQRQRLRHNSGKRVRDFPLIRRLLLHRVIINDGSSVDRGLLQVLRSLEITRRDNTLVIALSDAHRILDLSLLTVRTSCVPTDCVIRIRHQPSSLGGHLGTGTTLIVIRVVLRNIEDRLRGHQRELQTVHVHACKHRSLVPVVLEHVHRERRILHITTLNLRVDVHVIRINVTNIRQRRTIKRAQAVVLIVISDLAPLFLANNFIQAKVCLITVIALNPLKRQINLTVILRRHHYRLSNMGTYTMLSLVRLDNAFLVCTLLLRRVTIIGFLPRVNLTRDLIIKVRGNNLDTTGGAVTLTRLVLVVPRQRTSILTGLPPHHRLVRRSKALNGTVLSVVRELTINGRLASLTIKRTRPLILRLRQPINLRWLLLKHETPSSNTGTGRTSRKVPGFLGATKARGVAAGLHITRHNDGVLVLIRVLAPDTNLEIIVASQVEPWRIVFVGDLLR